MHKKLIQMEKKMKKLMLIAALGAAAIFTACGDDSSSSGASDDPMAGKSVVSCDKVVTMGGVSSHTCTAIATEDPAAETLKTGCVTVEGMMTATAGTGCPSGAELACPVGNTAEYFYDQGMGGFTCEQMASQK
jgi:hypothetical protein